MQHENMSTKNSISHTMQSHIVTSWQLNTESIISLKLNPTLQIEQLISKFQHKKQLSYTLTLILVSLPTMTY